MIWQLQFFLRVLSLSVRRPRMARSAWRSWYWMARCQWTGACYLDASTTLVYR